jgi:hypothetical protein
MPVKGHNSLDKRISACYMKAVFDTMMRFVRHGIDLRGALAQENEGGPT